MSRELDIRHCILIVVDALRADRLGVYNSEFEHISRYLSWLGEKAVVFKNAFTVINATDPSFTSLYAGMYPSSHGLISHGELVSDEELQSISSVTFLQEILSKSRIKTIAIDWLGRWHRRGFNLYIDPRSTRLQVARTVLKKLKLYPIARSIRKRFRANKRRGISIIYNAKEAISNAKKIIKKYRNERTFILVHLWDTHTPYNNELEELYDELKKRYRGKVWDQTLLEALKSVKGPWKDKLFAMFSPEARLGDIIARYDSAVAYVDNAIKEFMEFLEGLNLLDDVLLIITSDHGESLVEHGIFFDHHGLYEPSIRIPLIVYNPRLSPHTVEAFVQNIDLMPTILNVFNLDFNRGAIEGESLFDLISSKNDTQIRNEIFIEESYTERKLAIRTERYKYIWAPDPRKAVCRYCGYIHGNSLEELYDLRRDPGENTNIIEMKRDIARDLHKLLKSYIKKAELKRNTRMLFKKLRKQSKDVSL